MIIKSEKMSTNIKLLEDQLADLMSVIEPTESQGHVSDTLTIISPLERLVRTKPIWFLPEVTREESSHLLHNKKPGNFIIRGSRQPNTLAISVKTGTNEINRVQHFIILMTEQNVCLEDSDIKFDNLVSLVFHYSHTCDELPEKLCLPAVLATAESLQNLVSLSLLGKSFWTYPMARSGRTSLFVIDTDAFNTSCLDDNTKTSELIKEKAKVIKTPPIAPRKCSLGSNSSPPPARVRSRRSSDSVSFITSPAVSPSIFRNSLVNMANDRKPDKEGDGWVTSPVFANYTAGSRQRKVSVFDGNLQSVNEITEHNIGVNKAVYEDISEQKLSNSCDNNRSLHDKEYDDYACPVDAVKEDGEYNIYETPIFPPDNPNSALGTVISIRTKRFSDSNMRYGGDVDNDSDEDDLLRTTSHNQGLSKRKLSLGVLLRKISTGSLQAGKRKASLQERRLSNAFAKLITFPSLVKNKLGESYQVDSSSWEFLNKNVDDPSSDKDNMTDIQRKRGLIDRKHSSKDSLYESEYDSSSTLDSSSSSSCKAFIAASNTV